VSGHVTQHIDLRIDVADVAPPGCSRCAVEIVASADALTAEPTVLVCLPGGGMSRRYYDLDAAGYSFAEWCADRGYVLVLVDHPGVGDSDTPQDGWSLVPTTLAAIEAALVQRVLSMLRAGEVEGLPPLRAARVVGVGHSMGAGLLICQQAEHSTFDAIAVLGWSGAGLPEYLSADELALADREASAEELVAYARGRGDDPLPVLARGSSDLLVKSDMAEDVHAALVAARSPLLFVAGHASMIPGVSRRASTQIEAPVFIGVGEFDIARDPHGIPAEFSRSGDITLFVLPSAGHNHNVEPGRELLWARLDGWLRTLPPHAIEGPHLGQASTDTAAESIVSEAS
jgi:pimeloyl-ACP methyl ester carboxylesterase